MNWDGRPMVRCQNCGHYPVSHNGGRGGPPATGDCVAIGCDCSKFVQGMYRRTKSAATVEVADMNWYEKAVQAAGRIDPAHISPWKLASTNALLSIAESLASVRPNRSAPKPSGELRCANEQCAMYREPGTPVTNGEYDILTLAEVAEMTRTNPATLRYWRSVGDSGPKSFKLGRRVLYHRADVEQWIAEADGS